MTKERWEEIEKLIDQLDENDDSSEEGLAEKIGITHEELLEWARKDLKGLI